MHVKRTFAAGSLVFALAAMQSPGEGMTGATSEVCVEPPVSLVAWWPLDETEGTRIGNLRGAIVGSAQPGAIGAGGPEEDFDPVQDGALFFDGVDDAIEIPHDPALDVGLGDFSIHLWLRTDQKQGLVSVLDKRELAYRGYHLYLTDGCPGLQLADGGYSNYTLPRIIADGLWHHLVISVSRSADAAVRWYVDGELAGTHRRPRKGSLANGSPLRLGVRSFERTGWFHGALDEVALFDRALSRAEAASLFNAAALCKPKTLPPTAALCGGPAPVMDDFYILEGRRVQLPVLEHHRQLLVQCPADPGGAAARIALERAGLAGFTMSPAGSDRYPGTRGLLLAELETLLSAAALAALMSRLHQAPGCITHVSRVYPDGRGGLLAPLATVFAEFRPEISVEERSRLAAEAGLELVETDPADPEDEEQELVPVAPLTSTLCQANQLAGSGKVVFAEPDFWLRLAPAADPLFSLQWGLENTGQTVCGGTGAPGADADVPVAWSQAIGTGVTIAILDDGVQRDHPDLNVYDGKDFWNNSGDGGPRVPLDRHGTSCAGIAAAVGDNGLGIHGVAPGARLISAKFANAGPGGALETSDGAIREAIRWAWKDAGADVLSNSWGGGAESSRIKRELRRAKRNGRGGKGAVILFASGNQNGALTWQAELDEVIAVGASSPCDERKSPSSCDGESWWGSNSGSRLDVVAPGVKIMTTDRTGSAGYDPTEFTCFNGTSAATPFAAGVAALVLSANGGRNSDEVETILERSAEDIDIPGFDAATGHGRVNAARALSLAFCALSGSERSPVAIVSGARYRVFRFVPGETFIAGRRTLLKVKGTGGTGQNMLALQYDGGTVTGLPGYDYLLGSQRFSSEIRDVEYIAGHTLVSFADGRLLKVAGTGGTGQNMFAVADHPQGFTGIPGYSYYVGSHRFASAIRDITPIAGEVIFTFDNGKLLKVRGSCGSGFNVCAIQETASGFNGLSGYAYYIGDHRFNAAASVVAAVGAETLIGFDNGKMLKIRGTGGTGHNVFAIQEKSNGFSGLPGYNYYVGDHQFFGRATSITPAGGETLIGFANGKMLKIAGPGGTGKNMFAIQERGSGFSGLPGYSYYVGDQRFVAEPTAVLYLGNETMVGFADGRLLKAVGTGGTGHNMFAINYAPGGFQTVPGYSYLLGSANFNVSVTHLSRVNGETFLGTAKGSLLKVKASGGTGFNLFAVAREGGCFQGLCGYDHFLGCQDMSHPVF